MAFYIVSERGYNQRISWGVSYELEDIIAAACGAQIIAPRRRTLERIHWKWDVIFNRWLPFAKSKDFRFADEKNVLLLVGMGPGCLTMLDTLPDWRRRCEIVAAYIIDVYQPGIDRLATRRLRKITDKLDHLFVSYEQSIPKIQEICRAPVSLVIQAADALVQGAHGGERPIDLMSYGRRAPDVHQKLQQAFNYPGSPRIYYHSTYKYREYPDAEDFREARQMIYQLLRRTKITLNYRYTQTTAWNARGICPLTARWFECIAAGTVIVGTKPIGPEANREFDWPDAVIGFPEPNDDPVGFLTPLLEDKQRLQRPAGENYLEALRRHDWRYRVRDMLVTLKQPIPPGLAGELAALPSRADAVAAQTTG